MIHKTKKLRTGWTDSKFENKINKEIELAGQSGWQYCDIKISSKDNYCLLIFKKNFEMEEYGEIG